MYHSTSAGAVYNRVSNEKKKTFTFYLKIMNRVIFGRIAVVFFSINMIAYWSRTINIWYK